MDRIKAAEKVVKAAKKVCNKLSKEQLERDPELFDKLLSAHNNNPELLPLTKEEMLGENNG